MEALKIFQDVLTLESTAINTAKTKINSVQVNNLQQKFTTLINNRGSLFFSGVGKSGYIAMKLASTFSSLGLPSFFIHPVEALHGDLGQIRSNDLLVIISKSGTTEELEKFLNFVKLEKINIIGLLGNMKASLNNRCDLVFDCSVKKEACLNNQAPTTSTTLTLALGDAMAVFFESVTGLDKYDFAKNHPGGLLGKSISLKVKNLMIEKSNCAVATKTSKLKEILIEMTNKPLGACAILDGNLLVGLIVEGDIRRSLMKSDSNLDLSIEKIMNVDPISVNKDDLAIEALNIMEKRKNPIYVLPVKDENNNFQGIIRMHDLVKEGLK